MNRQQFGHNSRHRTSTRVEQYRPPDRPRYIFNAHSQILQHKSLKERIKGSLPAFIIGIALIFGGAALLFWNEGEAVSTAKTLDEGYNHVIQLSSPDYYDINNEDKLIHVYGPLTILTPLQDLYFGIMVKAVALKRRVQTYQWVEEESSFSPSETPESSDSSYSYSQVWKDKLVDSTAFYIPWGHENPTSTPIATVIQTSDVVNVGAYSLSPAIKATFTKFNAFSGDEPPDADEVKLHNGMYYFTRDIFNPQIGDIRVQFYFAGHDGDMITVIGKQSKNTLHPYVTSSGRELLIVRKGKFSVEEMFSSEHAQNRFLTWMIRLLGWFFIFIGMTSISTIVQYLVALSPLLRDMIFLGLGSANLTLSMSLSLILIGGAWCFYRPGLALFILLVAILPLIKALMRRHSRARSRTEPNRTSSQTAAGV